MREKIINLFLYSGLKKEQYKQIEGSLQQENRKILLLMSPVAAFLFLGLVISAFFSATMMTRMWLYSGSLILQVLVFGAAFRFGENNIRLTMFLVHIFNLTLYGFGFAMDIFSRKSGAAVAFVAILLICQLIFNEKPLLSGSMAILMGVLFLIIGFQIKTPEAFLDDILNVSTFVIAGFALNLMLSQARASNHLGEVEQRRQKDELQKALNIAAEANHSKTSFLFNMSHDIRTPMNAIIGYTDLLDRSLSEDQPRQREYVDKIRVSSNYLLNLLNNVLEMSRIESGKMELDENPTDVGSFNDSLGVIFEEEMRRKDISFTNERHFEHNYVFCDTVKLREIFLNILSNSVKYTPKGGHIHMRLDELPSMKEGCRCFQTTISDDGIGISEEFLPHLFESFSRERTATESKIMGTGLGMGIVKNLVDLMDGTIQVNSEIGKGTTTVIRICHRIASEEELLRLMSEAVKKEYSVDSLTGKRVLLAEDNDLNAEIAIELLEEAGLQVERAEDGIVCINMLDQADPGYYDIILMDVQMPVMDGYKASRTIRSMSDPKKANIPIIAMTANAFAEDRVNALDAGMDEHVAKPIDVPLLFETMAKVMAKRAR